MAVLHFDFTQSATRQAILEQLRDAAGANRASEAHETARAVDIGVDHCHDIGEVNEVIDSLPVSERVRADMRGVYDILAHAEAKVHGCEVEHTHFHEVGNASGIRNALEICLLVSQVVPQGERITATCVQTGSGKVECAHGLMDVPAPATAAILATGIPTCDELLEGELCTPTSAAIIKHFVDEFV